MLIVALLLMVLLSLLGVTLLTLSATEHSVAYNGLWSEGAMMAAEAGVNRGVNQISANADASVAVINDTGIGPVYNYRSGKKTDPGPTAPVFLYDKVEEGYDLSKWRFPVYQINATGSGPRNARREVEVQAEYGPIPR